MVKTRVEPLLPPCQERTEQACSIPLPTQNDVHNCVVGKQLCIDKKWGPCVDLDTEWGEEWSESPDE